MLRTHSAVPLNLITLHRWEETPELLVAEFSRPGRPCLSLWSSSLDDAVREAAGLAGLDMEFRDALGEEWDILVPEATLCHEFPDGEIDDLAVLMRRSAQLAEGRARRWSRCGEPRPVQTNP